MFFAVMVFYWEFSLLRSLPGPDQIKFITKINFNHNSSRLEASVLWL